MFSPTCDRHLQAELYVGTTYVGIVRTRYQIQTWGGSRQPESRITENLAELRGHANAGDLLIFQRRADSTDRFRLLLLKQGTNAYDLVGNLVASRRWGPLYSQDLPVSQEDLQVAHSNIETLSRSEFTLLAPRIQRVEARHTRIARSAAFRDRIRMEYGYKCCVTGINLMTPTQMHEVESAHVVPISEGGTDDIRNGIALIQTLHWAFDRGLFGISSRRQVYIPNRILEMPENDFLRQFHGKSISEATTQDFHVHKDALEWHLEHRVRQWE